LQPTEKKRKTTNLLRASEMEVIKSLLKNSEKDSGTRKINEFI
jgi:hypothetical protein